MLALSFEQPRASLQEAIGALDEETDAPTYISLLRICCQEKSLEEGKLIHSKLSRSEHASNRFFNNLLVEMYGKCHSCEDAYAVFESMKDRNVVSWNIMAGALTKNKRHSEAVELFHKLLLEGITPHKVTYLTALEACSGVGCPGTGRQVHQLVRESGHEDDLVVANSLINMYGRCSNLEDARRIFDRINNPDAITWNCLLTMYARNGYPTQVLSLFEEMDVKANKVTYLALFEACATMTALEKGRLIHRRLVEDPEVETDTVLWNSLLNMYGKCRSVEDAAAVFINMRHKNVVTWTGMISVYAQNGHCRTALHIFQEMDQEGVRANLVTFVTVLDACAAVGAEALEEGRVFHRRASESGLLGSLVLGNSLLNMYTKCGSLREATLLFERLRHHNLVAWNTLLTMHVNEEHFPEALKLLQRMDLEGVKPDRIAYLNLVTAVTSAASLNSVELLARITSQGMDSDVFVGNALLTFHCKRGDMELAESVFNKIHKRSVVAWTTMVCRYAENGHGKQALRMFREMDLEGVRPDSVTFIGAVDACASLTSLAQGKLIHEEIRCDPSAHQDTNLGNALINMYGRCGSLALAETTFQTMHRDLVSWNTMLAALAQNGHGNETVELLKVMNLEGVPPNDITLLGVIFGCGNAGLLEDGHEFLMRMEDDFGLKPKVSHFGCLADLFGKAGQVERTESLLASMPVEPDARAWQTLIGACGTQGDVGRATRAAKRAVDKEPGGHGSYVLLSNIYTKSVNHE